MSWVKVLNTELLEYLFLSTTQIMKGVGAGGGNLISDCNQYDRFKYIDDNKQ